MPRVNTTGQDEGFDEFFDPPLEDKYKCPICLLGLREPVQTKTGCGHRFCKSCIVRKLRESGNKCPVDNGPLLESEIFADKFAKREIGSSTVWCRQHKGRGCLWKGALDDLEAHLNTCQFKDVPCSNKCGNLVLLKNFREHLNVKCPKRKVECEYCKEQILFTEMKNHVKDCPKYKVQCPKCEQEITNEELTSHRESVCPKEKIKCPLHELYGCKEEGFIPDIKKHISADLKSHYPFIAKANDAVSCLKRLHPLPITVEEGLRGGELTNHQGKVCPKAKIKCPLHQFNGCKEEGFIPDIEKHISANAESHFPFLAKALDAVSSLKRLYPFPITVEEGLQDGEIYNHLDDGPDMMDMQMAESHEPSFKAKKIANVPEDPQDREIDAILTGFIDRAFANESSMNSMHDILKFLNLEAWCVTKRKCTFILKIDNYEQRHAKAVNNTETAVYFPPFYTGPYGYKMCSRVFHKSFRSGLGHHVSLLFCIMPGEWDDILEWPFTCRITIELLGQSDNVEFRSHPINKTLDAKPNLLTIKKPTTDGNKDWYEFQEFCQIDQLVQDEYVKNILILVRIQVLN